MDDANRQQSDAEDGNSNRSINMAFLGVGVCFIVVALTSSQTPMFAIGLVFFILGITNTDWNKEDGDSS